MTILEQMARAILDAPMCVYHQNRVFPVMSLADTRMLHEAVLLCTNCAANRARAARDTLVEGLTEGFVEDLVDNGVIWVIDCDEICWDLPRVRAALIEATEVGDE